MSEYHNVRRVTYNADNAVFSVLLGKLGGVKVIPCLANSILRINTSRNVVVKIVELDASPRGKDISRRARHPNDSHRTLRGRLGSGLQEGREQFRKEKGAETIGPDLQLVALFCLGPLQGHHDAGIVKQIVEPRLGGEKLPRGIGYSGQVGEVQLEEAQRAIGLWVFLGNVVHGGAALFLVARGDPEARVLAVEDAGDFLADTRVGAGDDADAAREVGDVGFCEVGFGGKAWEMMFIMMAID